MFFRKFGEKIKSLFGGRKIDEAYFEELEDTIIEGDLGARLTDEIVTELRDVAKREGLTEASDLQSRMKDILSGYISGYDEDPEKGHLTVYMILGVNGVGKTTTIAKMSKYFTEKGLSVVMAAGDTFRAAAVDQLDIHAERLGMRIVKQQMGSDPGAVIFDAITSAEAHHDDLILADTAGRMHNKENLMKELKKMDKVIHAKGIEEGRYKKFLVIDSTTGQNGVSQAHLFNEAVHLDGIILTKYDSAAKGGALIQIGRTLGLPVVFVCVGEGYDDIRRFDKDSFLNSLLGLDQ